MHLKEWKKANGLSYFQLAIELDISRSFAYKLCAGMHWPNAEIMHRIKRLTKGAVTADDTLAGLR